MTFPDPALKDTVSGIVTPSTSPSTQVNRSAFGCAPCIITQPAIKLVMCADPSELKQVFLLLQDE